MKPEIVGFAVFPWILYYLDLYKKEKIEYICFTLFHS